MVRKSAERRGYRGRDYRGYRPRQVDTRDPIERFLIVCEGERTEPNYFKAFPVPTRPNVQSVEIRIEGTGYNTLSLVQYALQLREDDDYDQVWCVFDRDSFPAQSFADAIMLARREGLEVAYSNEAFELWYLLHFNYYDTAISRAAYIGKLTELLSHAYRKNDRSLYAELQHKQNDALRNAARLLEQYSPSRPESDNPSTTVHLLVQQLNRFIR